MRVGDRLLILAFGSREFGSWLSEACWAISYRSQVKGTSKCQDLVMS
jgi:hypothetical protein